MRYNVGDQILKSDLDHVLTLIHSDLRKTNLFLKIEVIPIFHFEESAELHLVIKVQENWYIYPYVIFELADRNFNVWWDEYKRSFKRVNYGIGAYHVNLTGANDRIKLKGQLGFAKKLELLYLRPAITSTSKFGLKTGIYYSEYHEIAIQTLNNKQFFLNEGNEIIYTTREISLGTQYKENKFWNFNFGIHYFNNRLRKEIANQYQDYLLDGKSKQHYFLTELSAVYFDLDDDIRPTRGKSLVWTLKKTGLTAWEDYNYLTFSQQFKGAKKLFYKTYLQISLLGQIGLDRNKRPYNLYKSLGYNDNNISGYEYYVIDGLDYVYLNNELRYFVKSFKWNFFKVLRNEPALKLKLDIDIAGQLSAAYVNDPFYPKNNFLVNTPLYSSGIGLNLTINDVFQINVICSVNHLKETGIYFHTRKAF